MSEGVFFQDLAVLMTVAGVVSILFTRLGWPKAIGWLMAGILMSANTWGGAFLVDSSSITTFGQLGIVFLMFSLGLEFSASEMKKTQGVTVPTATFDLVVMIWLGYTVGRRILGWEAVPSLFLGAALCDSATTLLAKTIAEMKWSSRPFVKYIFGTTIFEDILCVGVLALITGVAKGRGMSLVAAGYSLGSLLVFFVGVIVVGLVCVLRLLDTVAKTKDAETLLLTLLGCCFLVSFVAFKFDFSLALGAFLVGILGASAHVRDRLVELVAPLRTMFSAVFFVSIGLLVDPAACWQHLPAILGLTLLVVAGKGINCFVMSLLTGQSVKNAVQTGMGLAQIGEFAFLVALLYRVETQDAANPIFQIVVGVSLITTCLNPIMLRLSDPFGDWLEAHQPAFVRGWLSAYCDWLARARAAAVPSAVQRHARRQLVWIGVMWILFVAVSFLATVLTGVDWGRFSTFFEAHKRLFFSLAANLFFVSLFAPLAGCAQHLGMDLATILAGRRARKPWHRALQRFTLFLVRAVVLGASFALVLMLDVNLQPAEPVVRVAFMAGFVLVAILGWKRFRRAGVVAGRRFREAVDAEKRRNLSVAPQARTITLTVPGDFYAPIAIPSGSPVCGRSIKSLDVRARTGASIVAVVREGHRYRNPGPDWVFQAGDEAVAIGDPPQITAVRTLLG